MLVIGDSQVPGFGAFNNQADATATPHTNAATTATTFKP
jgi:hypothetical protein